MNGVKKSLVFVISLCFLNCTSGTDKRDTEVKQNPITPIVLTISVDKHISINNEIVEYCKLEKFLEPLLNSSKEIELRPDSQVEMHFVKCTVWKLGNLNIDSVRLRLYEKVVTVPTDKSDLNSESEKLYVVLIDEQSALLNKTKTPISELQKRLLAEMSNNDSYEIILSVKVGVSYSAYSECKESIENTINMRKIEDTVGTSFSARIVETSCKLCY